jgi:nitroimidazol reductase NimA-like FMN-containing flavoprotein (pyridoxamine 5'-phosphate oxidase superfamily)
MPEHRKAENPTPRTKVRRIPENALYKKGDIHAILDEGLICHLGFVHEGQPFVIPTVYGRDGDSLYIHGSIGSRMLKALKLGTPACVTVTLLDGLVLARSAFNHSMNYRSVVVLGKTSEVLGAQKLRALEVISEHILRGRWKDARKPNHKEMIQTTVLSLPIDECSAKVRSGPPEDDAPDYALDVWAGVVPLKLAWGTPSPDPRLDQKIPLPSYL